ncbi:MAG: hypothetical protein CMF72_22600 [Mameliella sp.]|nr:hypothetical protein [Mameliella sp.]
MTCARSYVYRQFKPGGKLENALVGSQVDLNHPDAAHFCASQGYSEPDGAAIAQQARAKVTKPKPPAPKAPDPIHDPAPDFDEPDPEDVSAGELLEMPLREVVARFGTASHLKDYVGVVKSLVQTRGYEDEQARKRKDYIHRVHVEQLVTHIDALQKALLADAVKNMATRTVTQVAAGEDQKNIEAAMRDVISRTIKAAKSELERRLRDV